jgi:hypothetical protein
MINVPLEIERLKTSLLSKGLDYDTVEELAANAEQEIMFSLRERLDSALEMAVHSGVEKDSVDFINELRPRPDAFVLETESGITDFSDPPYPMLDLLLAGGAKPMKDGSGVYKVIPVGSSNKKTKTPIHTNIFDAQKAIAAERYANALSQYSKVAPKGSKAKFRTATSKQNRASQWVLPAKEKDFTADLQEINVALSDSHDDIILRVIKTYEDGF